MPEEMVPPHDLVAEQNVLGAMMKSAEAVWEAFSVLEPADFYQPKHETIYRAIQALTSNEKPVDFISVGDELQRTGQLQKAGDVSYLAELTNTVLTAVNIGYYAGIVRDHAIRRRTIQAAERMLHVGYRAEGDAQEALEAGRSDLDQVVRASTTDVRNVSTSFQRVVDELGEQPKALPTPWWSVDELIVGLMPGKLYVIGARPGEGKTIFGLQLARALCVGGNVAFSSLEMAEDELTQRLISSMAEVNLGGLTRHKLNEFEWDKVREVRPRIERMPLFIDDRSGVSITQIKSFARSVARKGKLGGVVVDYLQLVSGTANDQKRYEVVSEVSRQLKIMAKELDCPVVALSQLNRDAAGVGKMRRRPTLADLRESGSIEQDADVVMLLQRVLEKDEKPGNDIDVIVAKNRAGRVASRRLKWEAHYARISVHTVPMFDAGVPD